jgi:hypothetical protein
MKPHLQSVPMNLMVIDVNFVSFSSFVHLMMVHCLDRLDRCMREGTQGKTVDHR